MSPRLLVALAASGCCALSNDPTCSVEPELPASLSEVPDVGPDGEPYGPWVALALADGPLSCGLRESGAVQCWGEGELPPEGRFDRIAAGDTLVCAQHRDGDRRVECWGSGEVDAAALDARAVLGPWSHLEVGSDTVCGSTDEPPTRLECWGGEARSYTGGGPFVLSRSDVPCLSGIWSRCYLADDPQPPERMLAMDRNHLQWCGIRLDGGLSLQCWGRSAYLETPPPGDQWLSVDVGGDYACAIEFYTGRLACWGEPSMAAGAPVGLAVRQVEAARDRACALTVDGEVICWSKEPGAELVDCTNVDVWFGAGFVDCEQSDFCELDFGQRESCCECAPEYCDTSLILHCD